MFKNLWRFLSKVIFLAFMLSGRPVLLLILVSPLQGWFQAMFIVALIYPVLGVVPVRYWQWSYWEQSFLHTNHGDQVHKFPQVQRQSVWNTTQQAGGGAFTRQIIVQPFPVPQSSLTSAAFKALSHSSCYEPHSHTPHVLPRAAPWLGSLYLLSPRLNRSINWIQRSPC